MATLFSDNFNRANSDNLGANWTEVEGPWEILANRLRDGLSNGDDNVRTTTTAHAAVADVKVSVLLVSANDKNGPCARYSTTADTHYLGFNGDPNSVDLYKKVSGTYTLLQAYTPTTSANATVRLECQGTTQRLFYNGVELTPNGTDTDITAAGQTGLLCQNINVNHDDFLVEDFAAAGGGGTRRPRLTLLGLN